MNLVASAATGNRGVDSVVDENFRWVLGIAVTLMVVLLTGLIAAFRYYGGRVSTTAKDIHSKIDRTKSDLQNEIKEVRQQYVRRDDFDGSLVRLDTRMSSLEKRVDVGHKEIRDDMRHAQTETNSRLDTIISNQVRRNREDDSGKTNT